MGFHLRTATKVYVNLAEPDLAEEIAQRNVDGVGLLRAEFMISEHIKYHPKKLIEDKKQSLFVDKLAEGMEKFCRAFNPRPVVYRATDFKTNEYRNLTHGKYFEPEEQNVFDDYVDENGNARFYADLSTYNDPPGLLNATFITRAFEEGGDYSIDQMTIPYAPYKYFVGLKTPKGDVARGMLLTDEDHKVDVVTVDAEGNPVSRKNLE